MIFVKPSRYKGRVAWPPGNNVPGNCLVHFAHIFHEIEGQLIERHVKAPSGRRIFIFKGVSHIVQSEAYEDGDEVTLDLFTFTGAVEVGRARGMMHRITKHYVIGPLLPNGDIP